eukprot:TRINITY_DN2243_c0_g1_i1.p1 TRINITY_DN2243_c0_g1~~TRINITY_DN2243_c0_g1_i1.p1  ORF type:complete len:494 (+),score=42.89 TRINITY_DN2243_c0_g1_i1:556-2037(+)
MKFQADSVQSTQRWTLLKEPISYSKIPVWFSQFNPSRVSARNQSQWGTSLCYSTSTILLKNSSLNPIAQNLRQKCAAILTIGLVHQNSLKNFHQKKMKFIALKVGQQFEAQGKYPEARKYFEGSQIEKSNEASIREHNRQCYAGIARTSARLGDVSRALSISKSLEDKTLTIEIATVCESMKQYLEAAQLFESVGLIERAASIYLQIKHIKQAIALMDKIHSPKLLRELAKVREAEKQYKEAEKAYEKANDWENVVRLNLQYLDGIEKAKDIIRTKCPTAVCAQMIADHCEKSGNRREAIEFLIMAGKREEAFVIAQSHDEMDTYRDNILKFDDKNIDEHLRIAQYFEGKNQWGKAALHYSKCDNFTKSLKLYMQAGESYIPEAIHMVAKLKNDALTNQMVDYLTGEIDNIPKDAMYTLQLYKELGDISQVVRIALTISLQEQEIGNYKSSHDTLFEVFRSLKEEKKAHHIRTFPEINGNSLLHPCQAYDEDR